MKKTTIQINGKPFTYSDEDDDISYESLKAITVDEARKLLETTKKLFDNCSIKYSLAFGTLLGAVRDKTIIKGDEDVDVLVYSEKDIRNNLQYLSDNGLKLCRIQGNLLYSFKADTNGFIDVYIINKLPISIWSLWCDSIINRAIPRRYIRKLDEIEFLGDYYPCPKHPEKILEFWYGKTWKIPIKGHIYTYEVPSRLWWTMKGKPAYINFLSRSKRTVKLIIGWGKRRDLKNHHQKNETFDNHNKL